MLDNYEKIFQPKSIKDIVFASQESRELIEDLVSGEIPFPITEGKCGILLYGVPGTGKSALAKLLPDEIERARGGVCAYETYVRVEPESNGLKLLENIKNEAQLMPFGKFRYFVLDEVDVLTRNAMVTLKSVMNYPRTLWIMTTNNFDKIETGVKDRCYCIPFNAAPSQNWLPFARRILTHAGVAGVTKPELLAVIDACNGSARQITEAIVLLALKVRRSKAVANQKAVVAVP